MGYQALYRRYRPARFEDFVGQEAVIKTLRSQITSGRIAHAYLFCGTRGTGKTSTVVLPSDFSQSASMFEQMLTAGKVQNESKE